MSHARTLASIFILLITFAACQTQDSDLASNSNNPANASGNAQATPPPPLTEREAALIAAAVKGNVKTVRDLLEAGVNVNATDPEGRTPLTEAAWFGHTELAKLLIDRGADLNAKKKHDGASVLQLANMRGHKELAEILKRAGAK